MPDTKPALEHAANPPPEDVSSQQRPMPDGTATKANNPPPKDPKLPTKPTVAPPPKTGE